MEAAGVFLAAILVGGAIAVTTGVIAVVGLLQALRSTGLHHEPPRSATSITARQRAVDARLRARYLQRQITPRPRVDLTLEPSPEPQPENLAPEGPSLIGSLVSRLAE
ncbi:MAG TPA: hypothetical protein VFH90_00980 [Candidatus Limnocylindria bacterium]|nr:hypothetical protein [Candidatus Limnocylindria bacterium]